MYNRTRLFAGLRCPRNTWKSAITKNLSTSKPLTSILDLGKLLLQYSRDGDIEKVNELIIKGAPFNADWLGMTPLHYAAKSSNYIICDMLLRGGINKDARTKVDRTALHFASYEGNKEIVELLLLRNVDVNIKDMLRMTALHWAIEKRHSDIAKLLIMHGADISIISKFEKSPISIAIHTGQLELLHDLETVSRDQQNNVRFDSQAQQLETSVAVNSITVDSSFTSKLNLNPLAPEIPIKRSEYSPSKLLGVTNGAFFLGKIEKKKAKVSKQSEQSALEILKHHGITMLPQDDSQHLLTTALQGGRKLVLSEAGRLVLKEADQSPIDEAMGSDDGLFNLLKSCPYDKNIQAAKCPEKKSSISSRSKSITSKNNKNVKIISMDTFKRMYGNDYGNCFGKIGKSSNLYDLPQTKLSKLIKLNNASCSKPLIPKVDANNFREQSRDEMNCLRNSTDEDENEDLPPNIIEVCSESDSDLDVSRQSTIKKSILDNISESLVTISSKVLNEVPILSIPEICRKLVDLQDQMNHMRHQLEQKQQNEIHKTTTKCFKKSSENF